MKTVRFLSAAIFFAVSVGFISCGTMGDDDASNSGGESQSDNNGNNDPPPTPSSSSAPPPTPSSSSVPSGPMCGNVGYNSSTQFCSGTTVYSKCGGTLVYSPGIEQCCGNNRYTIATEFCSGTTVYEKCGGKEYDPSSDQFCIGDILYSFLTDTRDYEIYLTVDIGTQTWMAENLNYTPPSGNSKCPDNVAANCATYGRQYDWATAMALATSYNSSAYSAAAKHKGVCPTGWHIPSQAEWNTLANTVGTNPGTKLKDWSWNGTDDYGFAALPGGYVEYGTLLDSYPDIGNRGLWWTSSEYNGSNAYNKVLSKDRSEVNQMGSPDYDYSMTKRNMLSVRCVKD